MLLEYKSGEMFGGAIFDKNEKCYILSLFRKPSLIDCASNI